MSDSIPDRPSQAEGDVGDDDLTQGSSDESTDGGEVDETSADDRP